MKLVLADADLALVPLAVAPAGEPGAVLLQRSGLLARSTRCSRPSGAGPTRSSSPASDGGALPTEGAGTVGCPTALDRQILTLMLAGLSDQAVATQLDLSLRTVQRRLRHLQDLAGVQTRMQLGWYAARHDWA